MKVAVMFLSILRFSCVVVFAILAAAYAWALHWANDQGGYLGIIIVAATTIGALLLILKLLGYSENS
jgi:hypothetical protein